MKYINAHKILPKDIIKVIQEYVDGEYIYIYLEEKKNKSDGAKKVAQEKP